MMRIGKTVKLAMAAAVLAISAVSAQAAPVPFYNTNMAAGESFFDSTVIGAGGTVTTDLWSSLASGVPSIDRGAYTITRSNGANIFSTTYGTIPGRVIEINPSSTNVAASRPSGITFTFDNAVNGVGFDIGDWGTCCYPSALYIAFGGGAPIQVALANTSPGSPHQIFVGAIDSSSTFTQVEFWGDGFGEYLVAGGTFRYAEVPIGSVSTPLPASLALLVLGIAGVGIAARRRA